MEQLEALWHSMQQDTVLYIAWGFYALIVLATALSPTSMTINDKPIRNPLNRILIMTLALPFIGVVLAFIGLVLAVIGLFILLPLILLA